MRKFGLAAILSFIDRGATAAMGRVSRTADRMRMRFQGLSMAVKRVTMGLAGFATASLPVALAIGGMIRQGVKFEEAFTRVRAVLLDTTGRGTRELQNLAQTLGATTVFSATQAAQAMESLARAGLSNQQIMGAVRGTLAAAAAEGIGLAEAADVVASGIKAFGLRAEMAGTIAGSLALVSAKTNTTILGLKEGLKLAAPAAKLAGVSFQDTTAALGVLANVGLKGTLAGTAFRTAITKLTKPTKDTHRALAKLGLNLGVINKMIDKGQTLQAFRLIGDRLNALPKASARAGTAMRIFGLRGAAVGSAFGMTGKNLRQYNELVAKLRVETGQTAQAMADIQLQSVAGQVTLLKSAFEAVSIQIFKLAAPSLAGGVKGISETLGEFALALRVVSGAKFTDPQVIKKVAGLSDSMLNFAEGVRNAFLKLRDALATVGKFFGKLVDKFRSLPEDTQRKIAKIATVALLATGVLGPLIAAFGLFAMLAKSAIAVFAGLLSPFIAIPVALAAITVAIAGPKRAMEGLKAVFKAVKDTLVGVYEGFRNSGAFQTLGKAATELWAAFTGLLGSIAALFGTEGDFKSFGNSVGSVLGGVLRTVGKLVIVLARAVQLATKLGSWFSSGGVTSMVGDLNKRGVFGKEAQRKGMPGYDGTAKFSDVTASAKGLFSAIGDLGGVTNKDSGLMPAKVTKPPTAKDALVSAGGWIGVSAGDVVLDRASLAKAITSQQRGGLVQPAMQQAAPATGGGGGTYVIQVPVQVDGKQVALAVAEVRLDDLERGGGSGALPAGERSNLLQRGFTEGM